MTKRASSASRVPVLQVIAWIGVETSQDAPYWHVRRHHQLAFRNKLTNLSFMYFYCISLNVEAYVSHSDKAQNSCSYSPRLPKKVLAFTRHSTIRHPCFLRQIWPPHVRPQSSPPKSKGIWHPYVSPSHIKISTPLAKP